MKKNLRQFFEIKNRQTDVAVESLVILKERSPIRVSLLGEGSLKIDPYLKRFTITDPAPTQPDTPLNFNVIVSYDPTLAGCSWTAVSGVDGYNVYLKSNGEFVKDNSELITGTTYDIESLADGNYEAYATSVLNSVESGASNVKGFEVSTVPAEPEVEVFTADGTWDWTAAGQPSTVDVLVVAGGGGGGGTYGGGGGAGGVRWVENHSVSANVSVVVGGGGAGGEGVTTVNNFAGNGTNGQNSEFGSIVSIGGGYGQGGAQGSGSGGSGGSGGGGGGIVSGSLKPGGSGEEGQGNNGGDGNSNTSSDNRTGGGGGGSTQAGTNGINTRGGNGGDGLDMSEIFGTEVGDDGWFGGGGAGGKRSGGTAGGVGGSGGGADEAYDAPGNSGMANTGGGGGSSSIEQPGGNGGSGIVIVRWIRP